MNDWIQNILLGLIAIGFFNEIIKGVFQKKKINSSANKEDTESTKIIVDSANALVQPLTNRLKEAEAEASLLRRELIEARGELQKTVNELIEARRESTEARLESTKAREENTRITDENRRLRGLIGGTA